MLRLKLIHVNEMSPAWSETNIKSYHMGPDLIKQREPDTGVLDGRSPVGHHLAEEILN